MNRKQDYISAHWHKENLWRSKVEKECLSCQSLTDRFAGLFHQTMQRNWQHSYNPPPPFAFDHKPTRSLHRTETKLCTQTLHLAWCRVNTPISNVCICAVPSWVSSPWPIPLGVCPWRTGILRRRRRTRKHNPNPEQRKQSSLVNANLFSFIWFNRNLLVHSSRLCRLFWTERSIWSALIVPGSWNKPIRIKRGPLYTKPLNYMQITSRKTAAFLFPRGRNLLWVLDPVCRSLHTHLGKFE